MNRFATLTMILMVVAGAAAGAQDNSEKFYSAIRAGDLDGLKSLLKHRVLPNGVDRQGVTPLMNAAAVGSIEAMKALIEGGAEVNLQNDFGSTALMWSAGDVRKVRLLLDHGADVNKVTKTGRTVLIIAAMSNPSAEVVRLLLAKGADTKAKDQLGVTPFFSALGGNDTATIQMLANFAGDVNEPNQLLGFTPLMRAVEMRNLEVVKLLLAKDARVNAVSPHDNLPVLKMKNGTIAVGSLSSLMLASTYGPAELVTTLLDAGAKIDEVDVRGMTPLMLAITSDRPDPGVVKVLLARGADASIKSAVGETALEWAHRYARREAIEAMGGKLSPPALEALAATEISPRTALTRSVSLLETSSSQFFVRSGCFACHAQGPAQFAVAAAKAKGVAINQTLAKERVQQILAGPPPAIIMERAGPFGGDGIAYALEGMARSGYAPSRTTDFLTAETASEQGADGGWHGGTGLARSPLEDDDFSRTAMAIRLLKNYGMAGRSAEFQDRIGRAKAWLVKSQPLITEDFAMRVEGVAAAGASSSELARLAEPLLKLQRADGGWAQREGLSSDAYATGMALSLLAEAGVLSTGSAAYKNGLNYLLATQAMDGSWHVLSRAAKIQPYFEGGFPYGHDQWISSSGTAWAANALALSLDGPTTAAHR